MKRASLAAAILLLAALGFPSLGNAALQFSTSDGVVKIWGKYEDGDVARLKEQLTADIHAVVLTGISGGNWSNARDLAEPIEKAALTTVAHGYCGGYACSMMFLAGKERRFSAAGRPEAHRVEIPFIDYLPNYECGGIHCTEIPDWLSRHTKLSGSDLRVYHKSVFAATTAATGDFLSFLPAQAQFSRGNALHCASEIIQEKKKDFILADCLPMAGTTALNKGIVTSDERFVHASLTIKPDIAVPPPSAYAALEAALDSKVSGNDDCQHLYATFLRYDKPRAFVVSASGACYARAGVNSFRPYAEALNACTSGKKNSCRFYAVDDAVRFVPFDQSVSKLDPDKR